MQSEENMDMQKSEHIAHNKKWNLKKISILVVMISIVVIILYVRLFILGINIEEPRKEMARPIPLYGEYPYLKENDKERNTLLFSYESGLSNVYTMYTEDSNGDLSAGLDYVGDCPRIFFEIHTNGWIKVFYVEDIHTPNSVWSDYDYKGIKFLLTPFEYEKLKFMVEYIEKNNLPIDNYKDRINGYAFSGNYPTNYSYGVEMPQDWEYYALNGRLFYNGHWYISSDKGVDDLSECLNHIWDGGVREVQ